MTSTPADAACAPAPSAWPASSYILVGGAALLVVTCAALTVAWGRSMTGMGAMAMPGGWTMSMMWMRMPGEPWIGAWMSFVRMWTTMMVAMMLPSAAPMLWRCRDTITPTRDGCEHQRLALAGAGYFVVWAALGVIAFPVGAALAALAMRWAALSRLVPEASALTVVIGAAVQLTAWKGRHLACLRQSPPGNPLSRATGARRAWQCGVRLGALCVRCCGNLMVILLVVGVMDAGAMAVVTATITAERLCAADERVARIVGAAVLAIGLVLLGQPWGLGSPGAR